MLSSYDVTMLNELEKETNINSNNIKLDDEEIIGDNDDNDSSGSTFLGLLVLGASGYGGYKLVKKIKKKVKD